VKIDIIPPSATAAPAASTSNSAAPPIVAASAPAAAAPAPPSSTQPTPTVDDRSTAFRAVEGGPQMQSGEKLLVEAYAAIWIILFALILLSWRRQRRLDDRMAMLEGAIDKARQAEARSVTMGETPKPPPQAHEGGT